LDNRKLKLEELGRASLEEYKAVLKVPILVVLDNLRSGLNTGSIFRTADSFALEGLILTGITPRPPHKEIHKSAIGATQSVSWSYEESAFNAVQRLKSEGWKILVIEQTKYSVALQNVQVKEGDKYVVVMGNEVDGVDSELLKLADLSIEIPQFGTKHSLNVSVCAGIVLWHLSDQLRSGL
jgi:tRNA G18 (ribose-2'-O)-methylase SpoU